MARLAPWRNSGITREAVKGKSLPEWAQDFDAATWGQFCLKFLLGNKQVTRD
jgi:hypothetical protein